jgi:hypothetical protein
MSTINVTNVKHPSATNPAIVLDADGDATYAGVHDFSAATVTGAPQGLVHINTTTFSAQSSVSIDNVFSATYDNYLITYNGVCSAVLTVRMRWRVGGASNSTANSYSSQRANFDGTSTTVQRNTGDFADFAVMGDTLRNAISMTVFAPFLATATTTHMTEGFDSSGSWNAEIKATRHNQTVSYDGIEIYPPSGTITGTIRIYGLKNS